jgi:hypothetical protein
MVHGSARRPAGRSLSGFARIGIAGLLVALVGLVGFAGVRGFAQPASPSPDAERTMTLSAYFMREDKLGAAHREIAIPEDKAVAAAAMRELLDGPNDIEDDAGLTTAIPEKTDLLGIDLDSETKVATVDLSSEFGSGGGSLSMQARVAQVVFTLTQFPTIEAVSFMLDGTPIDTLGGEGLMLDQPLGRADFEDLTPLIFVESPAPGDAISSPVRIWGTANTFEATFQIDILDAEGAVIAHEVVTATSGSGTRGTFDVEIPFEMEDGEGTVVAYELSPRDGTKVNEIEIPVEFE